MRPVTYRVETPTVAEMKRKVLCIICEEFASAGWKWIRTERGSAACCPGHTASTAARRLISQQFGDGTSQRMVR
jgi:hypothetical protein